ncbi:MAG: pyrroline-5-carboxylate reductase [Endomicrobiaceae bacterium]
MISKKFYDKKVTFIGSGNMAEAIISGFVKYDIINRANIICNDISQERLQVISQKYAVEIQHDKLKALENADIVFLAIKPQQFNFVLDEYAKEISKAKLIVTIAAGISTDFVEKKLSKKSVVIRVMPNTPALVGKGAIAVCGGANATKDNITDIADMFSVIGRVVCVEEKLMNAITAVSGSGPAYVFYFSEVMRNVAEKLGIPGDIAKELVYQTIYGSGKMLIESGLDDAVLRKNVTSPGGTTEKAMEEFMNSNFSEIVSSALTKAKQRAEEL